MSGYFQIEFTADDDGFSSSDEDENNVHYRKQPPPPPTLASSHQRLQMSPPESSSTSTSNNSNNIGNTTSRDPADNPKKSNTRTPTTVPYKAFLCLYCVFILITSCICRAYFHGILRLIQRTVTDSEIRVMALAYDIGLTFGILPLCFITTGIHRPKLLGLGATCVGFGFLFACIPYFIMKTQLPRNSPEKDDYELCIAPMDKIHVAGFDTAAVAAMSNNNSMIPTTTLPTTSDGPWSTIWLIIGMLVSGAGSAPQFVVGIPYIDDTIEGPSSIPLCIALVISSHFGGLWLGQVASFFMWHHMEESDPEAFTRWWLGFFVAAMIVFVCGLVMFMFRDPKKGQPVILMEKTDTGIVNQPPEESSLYQRLRENSTVSDDNMSSGPNRVSRLARNAPFISLVLGGALEVAMMTGLLVFQPRFIGTVTGVGIAPAQLFTGSAVVFGVTIGLLIGAYLIYFRKWSPKKLSRIALIASIPALCVTWSLFFFHCGDPSITGGIKRSSTSSSPSTSSNIHQLVEHANFTAPCDVDCPCSSVEFTPVCGTDRLTYLSPCFAGCKNVIEIDEADFDGRKSLNFTDCKCVNGTNSDQGNYALSGACAVTCDPAWLYWMVLCILFVFAGIQYTPQLLLVIRCVVPRDRTAALCILVITWHLVGYVPALVYFSFTLNKSCILWSDVTNQSYHECLIYDSSTFHLYLCTLVVFLKSLSILCVGITYRYTKDSHETYASSRHWVKYETLEMESVQHSSGHMTTSESPAFI